MVLCASQIALRFAGDIVERDKPDENTLGIDDRQTAKTVLPHQLGRVIEVVVDSAGNRVCRHCGFDSQIK